MKTATTTRSRARALTTAQIAEARAELERMRSRYPADDDRARVAGEALRRIADGTYGICASCNDPIPWGRLSVMPETTHCVSCGPRT